MKHRIRIEQDHNNATQIYIDDVRQPLVTYYKIDQDSSGKPVTFTITAHNTSGQPGSEETRSMPIGTLTISTFGMSQQPELPAVAAPESMSIADLQTICHSRAATAGWWDDYYSMPEQFRKYFLASRYALIHSEASEAFEGMRKDKADDHIPGRPSEEVELADLIIRIGDYAGFKQLDLAGAIIDKLEYNARRQDHTREARDAPGGKKL